MSVRTSFLLVCMLLLVPGIGSAAEVVRTITFPVGGSDYSYRNDFLEPRGGGTRKHQGNDIIAAKMTPLVAAVDGYVNFLAIPQASWGYEVELQDDEGYTYDYLHVNNDTPGTDDGMGGTANAYAAGLTRGSRVTKGQLLGWVGDSGNAEETVPHLHFEMHDPNHQVINPYASLVLASGGKGVSSSLPSTGTVEPTFEERKAALRYIFSKQLAEGAEGSEVRQLQLTLKAMKYFSYPVATGYFGEITADALRAYQRKQGIPETGALDQLTRRALNTSLGTWDPNDYVPFYNAAEQRALKIAQLQQMILALQAQLKQMRGY